MESTSLPPDKKVLKRLLDASLQALRTTLVTLCVMVPFIFVISRVVAANGRPEPEQSIWSYEVLCFIYSSLMIFSQVPVLFVASAVIAFHRRRLRLSLALVSGMLLPLLDCLVFVVFMGMNSLGHMASPFFSILLRRLRQPAHMAILFVLLPVFVPLLASAVQLLPMRSARDSKEAPNSGRA